MKSFIFQLNCEIQARDAEEALDIAVRAKNALQDPRKFEYKIGIDVDNVEEV